MKRAIETDANFRKLQNLEAVSNLKFASNPNCEILCFKLLNKMNDKPNETYCSRYS